MSALVCGFWDAGGGLAGVGWDLGPSRGGLVARDGEVVPAQADLGGAGPGASLTLSGDGVRVEAELKPTREADVLCTRPEERQDPSAPEAVQCLAKVRAEGGRRVSCFGHLTRWDPGPSTLPGVFRHLAFPTADEGLLVVIAAGEPGGDHALEQASAWHLDAHGSTSVYPEALISTQYDGEGLQTRVGLELWSSQQDAPPLRGAGTVIGGAQSADDGMTAALLRTSTEGFAGVGSYLLRRG